MYIYICMFCLSYLHYPWNGFLNGFMDWLNLKLLYFLSIHILIIQGHVELCSAPLTSSMPRALWISCRAKQKMWIHCRQQQPSCAEAAPVAQIGWIYIGLQCIFIYIYIYIYWWLVFQTFGKICMNISARCCSRSTTPKCMRGMSTHFHGCKFYPCITCVPIKLTSMPCIRIFINASHLGIARVSIWGAEAW